MRTPIGAPTSTHPARRPALEGDGGLGHGPDGGDGLDGGTGGETEANPVHGDDPEPPVVPAAPEPEPVAAEEAQKTTKPPKKAVGGKR